MAKKAKSTIKEEMATEIPKEMPKDAPAKPKKKQPEISLEKYFQLEEPPIHIYTRAYVGAQFRGIIKTTSEWNEEMKQYFEEKE